MKPGPYVWKTKHADTPVTVVRTLGLGPDGRLYVQIEGTNTGIPADELTPAKPRGYSFRDRLRQLLGL